MVALDEAYNQAGLFLGENVDNDAVIESLRAKFGDVAVDAAIKKLQARIT